MASRIPDTKNQNILKNTLAIDRRLRSLWVHHWHNFYYTTIITPNNATSNAEILINSILHAANFNFLFV